MAARRVIPKNLLHIKKIGWTVTVSFTEAKGRHTHTASLTMSISSTPPSSSSEHSTTHKSVPVAQVAFAILLLLIGLLACLWVVNVVDRKAARSENRLFLRIIMLDSSAPEAA